MQHKTKQEPNGSLSPTTGAHTMEKAKETFSLRLPERKVCRCSKCDKGRVSSLTDAFASDAHYMNTPQENEPHKNHDSCRRSTRPIQRTTDHVSGRSNCWERRFIRWRRPSAECSNFLPRSSPSTITRTNNAPQHAQVQLEYSEKIPCGHGLPHYILTGKILI